MRIGQFIETSIKFIKNSSRIPFSPNTRMRDYMLTGTEYFHVATINCGWTNHIIHYEYSKCECTIFFISSLNAVSRSHAHREYRNEAQMLWTKPPAAQFRNFFRIETINFEDSIVHINSTYFGRKWLFYHPSERDFFFFSNQNLVFHKKIIWKKLHILGHNVPTQKKK